MTSNAADSRGENLYQLGLRIAALIATQGKADFQAGLLNNQCADLLGSQTDLLGPLRDLISRPAFRQLHTSQATSMRAAGRDALLRDLAETYQPSVVARLSLVVDGCLGQPPSPLPESVYITSMQMSTLSKPSLDARSAVGMLPSSGPGGSFTSQPGSGDSDKRIAAGLLGIFLGGAGIHKFLLGYTNAGIIMLLVSLVGGVVTCGMSMILISLIGLIEGLIYLTKTDTEFQATYITQRREWF